ncbi:protein NLRC3-like [Lampetra planeri]
MALKGVLENIQMFTKDQLQEFHVRIDEDGSSFVNEVFKRNTIRAETRYSFSHLIIQEFFAALAMYLPNTMQSVNGIIVAVESSKDGRFDMFQRFFLGLASDHPWEFLKDFLVRAPHSQKQIIEWLIQSFKAHKTDKHRLISLLHCLYELNDSNILSCITEPINEISLSGMMLTPHDCQVLSWFLQHRAEPFDKLDLSKCDISLEKIKILQPGLHRCKVLWLYGNNVKDEGIDVLSKCLHGEGGHLGTLSLGPCSLTDKSIPELKHIIRVNPNLKILRLINNRFSAHGKTKLENTCRMSNCKVFFYFN